MASDPLTHDGQEKAIALIGAALGFVGLLWLAGAASARLSGHTVPKHSELAELAAFGHFGSPSVAWGGPVGPAWLYWGITVVFVATLCVVVVLLRRLFHGSTKKGKAQEHHEGLADRRTVAANASAKALMRRASTLRPSVIKPQPSDVGYLLGSAYGIPCWMSVEDSALLLGPPRSGKGLHIVINSILAAPGACITTSTRPDNLAVTLAERSKDGRPVAVFDPQGLAGRGSHLPTLRWSPIRGCEHPQVAMLRAAALAEGGTGGVENGGFWKQQSQTAIQCLLHAAAVGGKTPAELYRWSHSANLAKEAVTILTQSPPATPGWAAGLDSIISNDPRTRDSVWAMVQNAFSPLADPAVLAAVSPAPGEEFTPTAFLRAGGTLYLLGTANGASATGGFIGALIEDVVDAARRLAASSPGQRLDAPLAIILDEAANYPIPSLPSLMSEGGGTGITTLAVFQSLAQIRDKFGRDGAGAIWDSAIVKIVLGGSANSDDLADISRLIGERRYQDTSISRGNQPGISTSTSMRTEPIMQPSDIRRIQFGYGLLLLRAAQPIMMKLNRWTSRQDSKALHEARAIFEGHMRRAAEGDIRA